MATWLARDVIHHLARQLTGLSPAPILETDFTGVPSVQSSSWISFGTRSTAVLAGFVACLLACSYLDTDEEGVFNISIYFGRRRSRVCTAPWIGDGRMGAWVPTAHDHVLCTCSNCSCIESTWYVMDRCCLGHYRHGLTQSINVGEQYLWRVASRLQPNQRRALLRGSFLEQIRTPLLRFSLYQTRTSKPFARALLIS